MSRPFVVCDMDGVLIDTSACHAEAFADLWRSIGVAGPGYATIAGQATRDVVARVTADRHPRSEELADWVVYKQQRARHYLSFRSTLFDDTRSSLERMSARGSRVALGTSASRQTTRMLLDRFDLARFFGFVVTADDVQQGKPSPEIYHTAMTQIGAPPDETLIIEDSPSGVTAGLDAGAVVATVRSGFTVKHTRFLGSYPDLRSLLNAVEGITQ